MTHERDPRVYLKVVWRTISEELPAVVTGIEVLLRDLEED